MCMDRNKRDLWLSKPTLTELVGTDGYPTGERVSTWSKPVHFKANISSNSGAMVASPYGPSEQYDARVVMDSNPLKIAEGDAIWAFDAPRTKADGTPDPNGSFEVSRVSTTLNVWAFSLRRREGR